MATPIENYVRSLLGRFGGDLNKTWKAIKHHPVFKSTTNKTIATTITNVQTYWQQAQDYVRMKNTDVVGALTVSSKATPSGQVNITYTIPLERDKPTSSSHTQTKTRTFSTRASASATKAQIKQQLADEVKDWLANYYEEKDPKTVINNLRVKGID